MNKSNKKNTYLVIMVALSLSVIVSSFAYFVAQSSASANTDVNVGTEVSEKLFFTPGDEISINANQENFAEGNGSISSETTSSATIIANSSKGSATGTYQVYLDIITNDFIYTVDSGTPELILTVTDPEGNEVTTIDGLSYKTVTDASTGALIRGFDITTYEGLIKIQEDETISTNNSTKGTTEEWIIKVTFVNLATDQALNEAKKLESDFILQKDKMVFLNEQIADLHGGVDGTNNLYYTNNAEYRYSGSAPDNYVWFNDEMWRIVGVFDETSHGQTDSDLIKIIRNETIGNYMFDNKIDNDNNGYNSWSDDSGGSELNQLLNGYYYNSSVAPNNLAGCDNTDYNDYPQGGCDFSSLGLSIESRNMVQEVVWHLGGYSSTDTTASMAYVAERSGESSIAPQSHATFTGKIGLMYMSDFGYSANYEFWDLPMYLTDLDNSDLIYHSTWMFYEETQASITHVSSSNTNVWYGFYGAIDTQSRNGNNIRPSVYLNSKVKVIGGTGSETEPFLLEM